MLVGALGTLWATGPAFWVARLGGLASSHTAGLELALLEPSHYSTARWWFSAVLLGMLVLIGWALGTRQPARWVRGLHYWRQAAQSFFTTGWAVPANWRRPLRVALGGYLGAKILLAVGMYYEYDELLTHFYFLSRTPLHGLAWYPEPNNHLLYTALCTPFDLLFADGLGLEPMLVSRLLSVVFDLTALLVLFAWLNRQGGVALALTLSLVWAALHPVLLYGHQTRGYSLLLLLELVWLLLTPQYLRGAIPNARRAAWVLVTVFGLWTLPSFAFLGLAGGGVALVALAVQRHWQALSLFVVDATWAVGIGATWYALVAFVNGPQALVNPKFVAIMQAPEDWADVLAYSLEAGNYFTRIGPVSVVLGVLLLVGTARRWRKATPAQHWQLVLPWLVLPLSLGMGALAWMKLDLRHWAFGAPAVVVALAVLAPKPLPKYALAGGALFFLLGVGRNLQLAWPEQTWGNERHPVVESWAARAPAGGVFTNEGYSYYLLKYVADRDGTALRIGFGRQPITEPPYGAVLVFTAGFDPRPIPPAVLLPRYRLAQRGRTFRVYVPR